MNIADIETLPVRFDDVVRGRTSIRAFEPTPVPRETILECLALAGKAPSNCNSQPWTVEILSGDALGSLQEAMLTRVCDAFELTPDIPWLDQLYPSDLKARQRDHMTHLQNVFGTSRHDVEGRRELLRFNLRSFGAPHLALLYMPVWGNEREAAISDISANRSCWRSGAAESAARHNRPSRWRPAPSAGISGSMRRASCSTAYRSAMNDLGCRRAG